MLLLELLILEVLECRRLGRRRHIGRLLGRIGREGGRVDLDREVLRSRAAVVGCLPLGLTLDLDLDLGDRRRDIRGSGTVVLGR